MGPRLLVSCLGTLVVGSTLPAQKLKPFPFFNRSDPKIETRVFVRAPQLKLACREVGVLPFSRSNQPNPNVPSFETFLQQALLQSAKAEMIDSVPALPWDNLPDWKVRQLTDVDRIGAVAKQGYSRKLDLVIFGTVDTLFRKPSKGLVARVTLRVISTRDGEVLWYGTKRADWLRRFALEDCLLHLAWSFVSEWNAPPK